MKYTLKIYLRTYNKPIKIEVNSKDYIDKFFALLDNDNSTYVNAFNIIIFDKKEFKFATIE